MRHGHATWRYEIQRLTECCASDITVKVVPEIGAVGEVKHLEKHGQGRALFDFKILTDPRVKLEEGLPPQIVIRQDRAISCSETISVTLCRAPEGVESSGKIFWFIVENDDMRSPAPASEAQNI